MGRETKEQIYPACEPPASICIGSNTHPPPFQQETNEKKQCVVSDITSGKDLFSKKIIRLWLGFELRFRSGLGLGLGLVFVSVQR